MSDHWVVIADSARAQVFSADHMLDELQEIAAFVHPASRLKAQDLVSGDRGATRGHAEGTHSRFERHTDPHRATVDAFARELANHLGAARVEHRYERLVIVAPPAFLGMLRGHLDNETTKLVVASVARDWMQIPVNELPQRLRAAVAEG